MQLLSGIFKKQPAAQAPALYSDAEFLEMPMRAARERTELERKRAAQLADKQAEA